MRKVHFIKFKLIFLFVLITSEVGFSAAIVHGQYDGKPIALGTTAEVQGSTFNVVKSRLYSNRPDVLKVAKNKGRVLKVKGEPNWRRYEEAYLFLLAQIEAAFPDSHYYFLARDIEYLYDTARVIYKDNPKMLSRLHLVPIGRGIQEDQYIRHYLEQEGLSQAGLGKRSAIFIDSCCAGSIPEYLIGKLKSKKLKGYGFLIHASKFPNSEVFNQLASEDNNAGEIIENHPHFTGSAAMLVNIKGRFEVLMGDEEISGGPAEALKAMGSIRSYYDSKAIREKYFEVRDAMKTIVKYVSSGESVGLKDAQKALEILAFKHSVPLDAFISDIKSLRQKKSVKIDLNRLDQIISRSKEFISLAIIDRTLKDIGNYSALDKKNFLIRASQFLLETEFEDLSFDGLSDAKNDNQSIYADLLNNLLEETLYQLQGSSHNDELILSFIELSGYSGSKYFGHEVFDLFSSHPLLNSKLVREIVQSILLREKCEYKAAKGNKAESSLHKVLNGELYQSKHLNYWLKSCFEELQNNDISIIAKVIINRSENEATSLSIIQIAFQQISKIDKSLVETITNNFGAPSLQFQSKSLKLLFLNRKKWEPSVGAIKIAITADIAKILHVPDDKIGKNMSLMQLLEYASGCSGLLKE